MIRLVAAMLVAASLISPALAQKRDKAVGDQEAMAAVNGIGEKWVAAYAKKDAAAIANMFVADGVVVTTGPVVSGRAAIQKYYQAGLDAGASDFKVKVLDAHRAGGTAWAYGEYSLNSPAMAKTTGSAEVKGKWGAVYSVSRGVYKIRQLTGNVTGATPQTGTPSASR